MKDNTIVLALKLFVICLVIALGLSALNYVTEPVIAKLTEEAKKDAMAAVLPDCELTMVNENVYVGTKDGETVGYAVSVTTQEGYGGAIEMMIGFDNEFHITGLEYISMAETPGLGTRAKEESFVAQFLGQPAKEFEQIDALTGATVTSKAVNGAINQASQMAKEAAK